jgi:apolipoprotein N-acyltransferase
LGLLFFQQLGSPVAVIAIISGLALMFGDDPAMRRVFLPNNWVEQRRVRLLLLGFGLFAAALTWLVISIRWELEPTEAALLPFVFLLMSSVLVLGVVFFSWLMRVLVGRD